MMSDFYLTDIRNGKRGAGLASLAFRDAIKHFLAGEEHTGLDELKLAKAATVGEVGWNPIQYETLCNWLLGDAQLDDSLHELVSRSFQSLRSDIPALPRTAARNFGVKLLNETALCDYEKLEEYEYDIEPEITLCERVLACSASINNVGQVNRAIQCLADFVELKTNRKIKYVFQVKRTGNVVALFSCVTGGDQNLACLGRDEFWKFLKTTCKRGSTSPEAFPNFVDGLLFVVAYNRLFESDTKGISLLRRLWPNK